MIYLVVFNKTLVSFQNEIKVRILSMFWPGLILFAKLDINITVEDNNNNNWLANPDILLSPNLSSNVPLSRQSPNLSTQIKYKTK